MRSKAAIEPPLRALLVGLVRGERNWPLTLWGLPGRGKTCAALSLCDHVTELQPKRNGEPVYGTYFWTVQEFYALVCAVKFGRHDGVGLEDFRRRISRAALIVLDELDRCDDVKNDRLEEVLSLVDAREGLPLILLANTSPDEVGRIYGARLSSRMTQGVIYKISGVDRRNHKG